MRAWTALAAIALLAGCSAADSRAESSTTSPSTIAQSTPFTLGPAPTSSTSVPTTIPRPTEPTAPPSTAAAAPSISVAEGAVVGPEAISVVLGEEAVFTVTADVTDEVHVHGYDLYFDLAPGTTTEVRFLADVPGVFEVEMEATHLPLVELVVAP